MVELPFLSEIAGYFGFDNIGFLFLITISAIFYSIFFKKDLKRGDLLELSIFKSAIGVFLIFYIVYLFGNLVSQFQKIIYSKTELAVLSTEIVVQHFFVYLGIFIIFSYAFLKFKTKESFVNSFRRTAFLQAIAKTSKFLFVILMCIFFVIIFSIRPYGTLNVGNIFLNLQTYFIAAVLSVGVLHFFVWLLHFENDIGVPFKGYLNNLNKEFQINIENLALFFILASCLILCMFFFFSEVTSNEQILTKQQIEIRTKFNITESAEILNLTQSYEKQHLVNFKLFDKLFLKYPETGDNSNFEYFISGRNCREQNTDSNFYFNLLGDNDFCYIQSSEEKEVIVLEKFDKITNFPDELPNTLTMSFTSEKVGETGVRNTLYYEDISFPPETGGKYDTGIIWTIIRDANCSFISCVHEIIDVTGDYMEYNLCEPYFEKTIIFDSEHSIYAPWNNNKRKGRIIIDLNCPPELTNIYQLQ